MKKRLSLILCLLSVCLLCGGCTGSADAPRPTPPEEQRQAQEIRAVWISYLELSAPDGDRSEEAFRAAAKEMLTNIRDGRMNTVFLHVRPFADALYRSSLFPYSAVVSGTAGKDPGYDALKIFCACAEEAGLSLHAWINPFRICSVSDMEQRADDDPAMRILRDDDPGNDSRIAEVDGMLYYDPANEENRRLILDGVRELLDNYPIDGVHIDDYFYPTTDPFVDQKEYDAYLAQGGNISRDDWRRAQIDTFVAGLYNCVKSYGQEKIFSISPALQIDKNRNELYADVSRWAAMSGYCDWLIPQVYVGFSHETYPFCETVDAWCSLERSVDVRLLFGLAAYKCGVEDAYAGCGRNEWIEQTDILSRQIRYLREKDGCSGFAMFSYSCCFGGKMSYNSSLEMNSVISML